MITTGFDSRVKIQQIIENQLPEFVISETPKFAEFLKQYYISQEFQGGSIDVAENLDQYQKLNNLTPEVISGTYTLSSPVSISDTTIYVNNTKGFPSEYGLLKINDEIITYTGITTNSFTGCVRGFSGIVNYHNSDNPEELEFSSSKAASHNTTSPVHNLSSLFLKEFYKKLKQTLAPGFENVDFVSELNVNNFIKQIKSFYQTKGTDESFRILYNVLYGVTPTILKLEDFLIKPSDAEFIRREVLVTELISGGDPNNLVGQEIRSIDDTASGPVSEVEIIKRNNKNYYKIQLFAGFNDKSLIEGTFQITPKTKVIDKVEINSSVITVDSTIGFDESGKFTCNNQTITYTNKSINQFFGCVGVTSEISPGSDLTSDKIVYGYEKGDTSKKVELRITGILSELENQNDIYFRSVGESISVKHIGEKIENPTNKSYKQIMFNSWIYNTSSRYEIKSFASNQVTLYEIPDKSSLKVGDSVNILDRNSENIIVENAIVTSIINEVVSLDKNITAINSNRKISIRRNIKYASSSNLPLKYPKIIANVQNTYDEESNYIHVASNSLPDYTVDKQIVSQSLSITSTSNITDIFPNFGKIILEDTGEEKYTVISFPTEVSFITGDTVVYTGSPYQINGLSPNETYYVEVIEPSNSTDIKNKIRLYNAKSFIGTNNAVKFDRSSQISTHTFTILEHSGNKKLTPKKILRKIPLNPSIKSGSPTETNPGPVGMLINGVEIINYKSNSKIYYGPLTNLKVLNPGSDYDVLSPPTVVISNPVTSTGTTALVDVIVKGNLKEVIVDPNTVNVQRVISASVTGGNGSGAVLLPIVEEQFKELDFNAQLSTFGGGLNVSDETISFLEFHNLQNGTPIVYNPNGNQPLGIGTYQQSNTDQGRYLINGAIYFPEIINTSSIKLYNTLSDLNSGINTVGFTTANAGGIHKFRLLEGKNILTNIKVLNGGSGYENRSLKINPSGISTISSVISFKNHGFNHGDLINYRTEIGFGSTISTPISGISTNNQYYVLKIDDSNFKLADAGIISLSPSKDNFERNKNVIFSSSGSGSQIFEYPKIKLNLEIEYSGVIGTITATPVFRGEIVDAYLYEPGTDYGSTIFDFHKRPLINIQNGFSAQLKPIIINGKIVKVEVQNRGKYYNSSPELIVNGTGVGAKLRANVEDGKIINIIVINGGTNYDPNNTSIFVKSSGKNGSLMIDVRSLTVNNNYKFSDEILVEDENDLSYGIVGYSTSREGVSFSDLGQSHSKIIGWSYDGYPIYGPYGYSNPNDDNSTIKLLNVGYTKNFSNVTNRPAEFDLGFFVEDYKYTANGDLDQHNGRFSKTPDFPNGIYAYYVGLTTSLISNNLVPEFPYFVGNTYKGSPVFANINQKQNFNFNQSRLIRNTFPYRVNQNYSNNDFILESNKILKQTALINSVSDGSIESLSVVEPGDGYSVNDYLVFDNNDTEGSGASASVNFITGKEIVKISTTSEIYENAIIKRLTENQLEVKINPYHNLLDGDTIDISGVSTSSISKLNGFYSIKIPSNLSSLVYSVPSNSVSGIITDIYVSDIPNNVSVGSSLKIENEVVSVLNIFKNENILRVSRPVSIGHTAGTLISFYPNTFLIDLDVEYFDSNENERIYFNPTKSVSVGLETGKFNVISSQLGNQSTNISVENQSIYIPNHPFKNNQKVLFVKPNGFDPLVVRNTSNSSDFNLPSSGNSQYVYIINRTPNTIGIVTSIGLTTTTNGLFFNQSGSNSDYYYFESENNQVKANIKKITTQVSVSTSHNLNYGDKINLIVNPGLATGIGTSGSVYIKYNSSFDKILVNPRKFSSSGISTITSQINIPSHGFITGDKVFYNSLDSIASGLSTGPYFINRVDADYIYLCDTHKDSISFPPKYVSILTTGGSNQEISLINPQLNVIKNNDLIFNVSDSSLVDYKLKFFFDSQFKNEFVSTGSTSSFSISGLGTVGISSNATITIGFNNDIPFSLYYNLEKSGSLLPVDSEVRDASKILYQDSVYNGEYSVFGVGTTTFSISLRDVPEKYSYVKNECETIRYYTNSQNAKGGIEKLYLISGGFGYKKLPYVSGISSSSSGTNAIIKPKSTNIGKIEDLNILNEGFEYASDKTLKPKADISRLIRLKDDDKIDNITVTFGGRNFISPPVLSLVNDISRKKISSGVIEANLSGSAILDVSIIEEPKGLESVSHTIFTEKNSNGIGVEKVVSYANGIVECEISTPPINGFTTPPFKVDDYIFVEGIQRQSITDELGNTVTPGTGFNSPDNGYKFFRVVEFINSIPAILKYNIGEVTSNAGVASPIQTTFSSIVKEENYPLFKINQVSGIFYNGEYLVVNGQKTNLLIDNSYKNYLIVSGEKNLSYNDLLTGENSGNIAKVDEDIRLSGNFIVRSSNEKNYGWKNDIGKLNDSQQVLPDNDYYQNLSYSIKTSGEGYIKNKVLTFDVVKDSINRLVHPTGMKNFVDVGITSTSAVGIGSDQSLTRVLDFISEQRVDTVNNFDLALDYLPTANSSNAIILKSKKVADYIQCISNRCLQIDDISGKFSSSEINKDTFSEVLEYSVTDNFAKFLIQITDEQKTNIQASELVVLNNYANTYTLNKSDLYTGDSSLGNLSGVFAYNNNNTLRFDPADPFTTSYYLKVYRDYFTPNFENIGVGYTDLGFLRLSGKINTCPTIGITTNIFQSQFESINSVYSNVFIKNEDTLDMNYFEVLAYHDGTNSYISEYYFDTENTISGSSFGFIGTFGVSVENGIFKLNFTNNTNSRVTLKSKTVGFGTTSSGIGTYRYLVGDQDPGLERSARLESSYQVSIGNTTIHSYDLGVEGTLKSLIRVGVGTTVALHQFLAVSDNESVALRQYPFLSVGTASTSGIGTFGAEIENSKVIIKFYPDLRFLSDPILIQKYDQFIYFDSDEFNQPDNLTYGIAIEELKTAFYGSLNNFGKDRLSFDLNYEGTPIFQKTFNPSKSNILNKETGVFTIPNHFFQTGEELIYTADSTLPGIVPSPVGIGTTIVGGRSFTGDFIVGFSTITGVASTARINVGDLILGSSVSAGTTIISIGSTFTYFVGDVVSTGSTVITGIANTTLLSVGSSIFLSDTNVGVGSIVSIGINSITSSQSLNSLIEGTYYSTNLNNSIVISNTSTQTSIRSNYITGIITDIAPSTVYAIRIDGDRFKLTGLSGNETTDIGFTYNSNGSGNAHRLEMKKKLEKCVITVNGVNQYPVLWTPLNYSLQYNDGSIGIADTFIGLSGISSIKPRDLIKVDEEFFRVNNVGFGTTNLGPITGLGTIPLVEVERGFVGSSATTHLDSTEARIYRGSFNIVGNKIHFSEPPAGRGDNDRLDTSSLPLPKSTFNGRVFLRRDYELNRIYDDISDQFNGTERTFTLTKDGQNIGGAEPGSGLVFINDIFQIPSTENNAGFDYDLNSLTGITTISFTGITRPNTEEIVIVDYDINQNQIPRGGIILSLGSTGGLGYAPLVGASVTAVIGAGGSITAVGIGSTDIVGSGYRGNVISIGITDSTGYGATITATVGTGGTLAFNVINGGSGYTNPILKIDSPNYNNLPITGVSRLSVGNTTTTGIGFSVSVNIGQSKETGIGQSFFRVESFTITKPGYAFNIGDKFKVVGLVTDARLSDPIEELIFTVENIFNDSFACWQFGELDYIDSIKLFQNGVRKRFPLFRNNELLSFEKDRSNPESDLIDFDTILLIFLNGVLQEPGVSYTFTGGTTFRFTEAPKPEDNIAIFFYRGTKDVDSFQVSVNETIKPGDTVQIDKNNEVLNSIRQDNRIVSLIQSADIVETGIYLGDGIDDDNFKPLHWTKQKRDLFINEDYQPKSRDSLESYVFPSARIIKDVKPTDKEIFVDYAQLFKYEENDPNTDIKLSESGFKAFIIDSSDPIAAGFTATVSGMSTISSIGILTGGNGYVPNSTITLKISNPIGIGSTALATANVSSSGIITSVTIINPGSGYTSQNPPSILCEEPPILTENIREITFVDGFSGIITGISTSRGFGVNVSKALTFNVLYDSSSIIDSLKVGYPILVSETNIGNGVTSINTSDTDVVGIGTTFFDNVYVISQISRNNLVGIITCNVLSTSNIVGIETSGKFCGRFSWGRLYGITRESNPVSIAVSGYTVNSGLTTFPQIVRRGYGLRLTGGLSKELKDDL